MESLVYGEACTISVADGIARLCVRSGGELWAIHGDGGCQRGYRAVDKDDSAFSAGVRYRRLFLADPQVSREGRYWMRRILCCCRASEAFRLGPRFHRAPYIRVYPPGGLPCIRVPDSLHDIFSAESTKEVRRIRPARRQEQPLLRGAEVNG